MLVSINQDAAVIVPSLLRQAVQQSLDFCVADDSNMAVSLSMQVSL